MHGKRFRIRTHRPRPIEADGEIVSMTPADVSVVPSAVAVLTPPDAPV
jgi:diacylglycerol kinase family enzyme